LRIVHAGGRTLHVAGCASCMQVDARFMFTVQTAMRNTAATWFIEPYTTFSLLANNPLNVLCGRVCLFGRMTFVCVHVFVFVPLSVH
jgi:hypothetical protein